MDILVAITPDLGFHTFVRSVDPSFRTLIKGKGHKYIKRTPTGKPKPKWRYWYKLPAGGVYHKDHAQVGTKFQHGDGHYEITASHNDGAVTIRHDETGKEQRVSQADLKKLVHEPHAEKIQARGEKLLRDYKAALKHGTDYHKNARRKAAEKYARQHDNQDMLQQIAQMGEAEKQKSATAGAKDPALEALEQKALTGEMSRGEIEQLGRMRKRPINAQVSVALSPDKKHSYHVQHKIIDVKDLITSHKLNGQLNEAYTQDLQSRHRGSEADTHQIATMSRSLEPMALLYDSRRTDEGSPILGEDNMVESGNGRSMALTMAAQNNNEAWKLYQEELRAALPSLGLSESDLAGITHPVIVRERLTGDGNKDFRVEFAEQANTSAIKRMSAFEEAQRDSRRITADMIADLDTKEDEGIDAALSRRANRPISVRYLGSMPANEAAALVDDKGEISKHGRERLKAAFYLYALPGEAGQTIAKTFVETSDHDLRNFDTAFSRTLPRLAQIRAKFNEGERDKALDLMPDMAKAIAMLDQLKRDDLPLKDYLRQTAMFGRQTTDLQDSMMQKLSELKRSPKKLRDLLSSYADAIESMPDPRQATMFGGAAGPQTTEEVWNEAVRRFDAKQAPAQQQQAQRGLF